MRWAERGRAARRPGQLVAAEQQAIADDAVAERSETGVLRARDGHRLAWLYNYGYLPEIVDHWNMCRSDNRIINLRSADKSTNATNGRSHRDSSSTYRGVSWIKDRSKWGASICKDGRHFSLGRFDNEHEASQAYARASVHHHGEYGRV